MNILVAEDDNLMLDLYRSWLAEILSEYSGNPIVVNMMSDGKELDMKLSQSKYDLTILDAALPRMSGIDLYKKHRDNMGIVMLCSSYGDFFSRSLPGVNTRLVLNKPFSKDEFKSEIETALKEVDYVNRKTNTNSREYTAID